MQKPGRKRFLTHHGYGEFRLSRYFALYFAFAGWFVLGGHLYFTAMWPSACQPDDIWRVYICSMELPVSGGWREASLLTWLWCTPILVLLEISRRIGGREL